MSKIKVPEFRAEVAREWKGLPQGANICVQYESKSRYYGVWPNGPITFNVSIPKERVKIVK